MKNIYLNEVYENINCQQVLKKVGDQIHARGGIQAMQANFTVLKWHSHMAKYAFTKGYCGNVEVAWDGIGTWQGVIDVCTKYVPFFSLLNK